MQPATHPGLREYVPPGALFLRQEYSPRWSVLAQPDVTRAFTVVERHPVRQLSLGNELVAQALVPEQARLDAVVAGAQALGRVAGGEVGPELERQVPAIRVGDQGILEAGGNVGQTTG